MKASMCMPWRKNEFKTCNFKLGKGYCEACTYSTIEVTVSPFYAADPGLEVNVYKVERC